jgi:predicted nucleic acid-binding OB-fold protein
MLFHPEPDAVIDRARIDDAPLPGDGKEILEMMVTERRSERLESMEEVQQWLEQVARSR